ncbi:hypothetical protein, partial [Streptobacillus felis]|uniref:hypothetical protein n=1 Tax=Streptobacillus felis TaxID=1384509 RepID=UPI000A5821B7
ILNEKLDKSYIFVRPILPNRKAVKSVDELLPGEELEEVSDKRRSRRNENLDINLSFPIKNNKIYLKYSNTRYLRSIITDNENIYDISGLSNRYEIKVDRKLNKFIDLISSYSYIDRRSYVEDVLSRRDSIHNFSIGLDSRIKEDHKLSLKLNNKIENGRYIPSFNLDYGYRDVLSVRNIIENKEIDTSLDINLKYKKLYSKIGFDTDYRSFNPRLKFGINLDISRLNIDSSLEYNKRFRALFALKFDIVK